VAETAGQGKPGLPFFCLLDGEGMGRCEPGAAERPATPDRKGGPHPCGSATPSLAWTLWLQTWRVLLVEAFISL